MCSLFGLLALVLTVMFYFGLDTALTSLFAYFDVEGWVVFAVSGAVIGLVSAFLSEEGGYIRQTLVWAASLAILWLFRPDGIIYACILLFLNWKLFDDN